jgi:hypothetical protein
MELPLKDSLRVDQSKITDYLLSESAGRGKATFFLRLGFRPENWEVLAEALKAQANANPVVLGGCFRLRQALQCGRRHCYAGWSTTKAERANSVDTRDWS